MCTVHVVPKYTGYIVTKLHVDKFNTIILKQKQKGKKLKELLNLGKVRQNALSPDYPSDERVAVTATVHR